MTTYGCNALYRDFMPNYLISLDTLIVSEILDKKIHKQIKFYTQDSARFNFMTEEEMSDINILQSQRARMDSGNSAIEVAAKNKHEVIYIIGFDYNQDGGTLDNVYINTQNYARTRTMPSATQTAATWRLKLRKLVKEFSETQFIRVNGSNTEATVIATNYSEITPEQFKEIYDSRN
jgi:hypothetical protein